jgi:hypothetical protein
MNTLSQHKDARFAKWQTETKAASPHIDVPIIHDIL